MSKLFQAFLVLVLIMTFTILVYKTKLGNDLKTDATTTQTHVNAQLTLAQTP